VGLGAVTGLLSNGNRPADIPINCNVEGVSGVKVGATGGIAGVALHALGANKGWSIAGGLLGAAVANNSETDRIRQDCLRQQANNSGYYQQPQGNYPPQNNGYAPQPAYVQPSSYNNNYNNGGYNNGGYNNGYAQQQAYNNYQQAPQTNYPRYPNSGISAMPSDMVVYATENAQGYVSYVNVNNSPGIASMRSQRGGTDPYSNQNVQRDMQETMNKMIQAHQNLQNESNNYLNVSGGRPIQGQQVLGGARDYVDQANMRVQQALSDFSRERAFFAMTADNAANSGYNLSSYSNALNYMDTPQSVKVAYGGRNINRFSTLKTQYGNR